jgi:ketosteroid isomerase-like protein
VIDAGDTVVMLGRYTGTYKGTGKALDAQVAHVWRARDGKVTGFQQHADTLHAAMVHGTV